jgi:hypothetical protein
MGARRREKGKARMMIRDSHGRQDIVELILGALKIRISRTQQDMRERRENLQKHLENPASVRRLSQLGANGVNGVGMVEDGRDTVQILRASLIMSIEKTLESRVIGLGKL